MAALQLRDITKTYDSAVHVVRNLSLDIRDGEFIVFVGPSGCGKSTTLRMIAGLEDISAGELRIGERLVNDMPSAQRGVAMVFQSYALYPHMTVAENMGFALKLAGKSRAEVSAAVAKAAQILRIEPLLERKPKALSGGQRQRVAIGRCIVRQPDVFLFDEPLSNLDAALRVQMRGELARLHRELGTTMVYVTHDQVEAMTLGERIVVFNQGVIEQCGTPMELYERPANRFVASFIGSPSMNFLPVTLEPGSGGDPVLVLPGGGRWAVPMGKVPPGAASASALTLGLRPEHLGLVGVDAAVPATVELVEYLGGEQIVHVSLRGTEGEGDTNERLAVKLGPNAARACVGDPVGLQIDPNHIHFFGPAGQALTSS